VWDDLWEGSPNEVDTPLPIGVESERGQLIESLKSSSQEPTMK